MNSEDSSEVGILIHPSRPEAEGPSSGETSGAGKRRPARRDPEKRRLQNIQAQKKYREKLKKRLDHLEGLAASARAGAAVSSATTPEASPSVALVAQSGPSGSAAFDHYCTQHGTQQGHGIEPFDFLVDFSDSSSSSSQPAVSSETALWDPTTSVDMSHLIRSQDTASRSRYWVGLIECGCVRPHFQVSSETTRDWGDMKVLSIGPSLFAPDPYLNRLRIERICILEAIMSNCLQIGITEEMFCGPGAISPFFRSGGNTMAVDSPGPDNTVTTVQRIFKTLKPDVRPIKEQITMEHRPMIDVLPFPTFRKNLIEKGDAISEEELYHDLLDGLLCWGGAGVGKQDRDTSTGYVSTGTPWDSRSWEAKAWFLQKYWALLGGEDGELVRQSQWWRNMRGEEIDF